MIKGHIETIKRMNRRLIIKNVKSHQPISRSGLAKKLSLSKSTVSSIVNELVSQDIINELGHASSTKEGGRRPMQLGINANIGYIIGIDLKADFIRGYLTDLNGDIIISNKEGIEGNIQQIDIINFIKSLLNSKTINSNRLLAIGISIPGMVNSLEGLVIEAPELGWRDIPIADWIKEHFHCPIFVNNNVNCLAMAEKWSGSANDTKDFVYIYIGYGIGSAIIANNKLITGSNFTAGEIGYFAYQNDNLTEKNTLGEFGIFDNNASLLTFPEESRSLIKKSKYGQLDHANKEILDGIIHKLSFTIGNIISFLNPEMVVIGGELSELINSNTGVLYDAIKQVTPIPFHLTYSELPSESASLGSVSLALDKIPDLI